MEELEWLNVGNGNGAYFDTYIDKTLVQEPLEEQLEGQDTLHGTVIDWQGKRQRIWAPSIDAVDPVYVRIRDGKRITAYHVPGNITLTSSSVNMLAGTLPKVFIVAIAQAGGARDRKTYANAVAAIRSIHVYTIESELGVIQHMYRVGRPVPVGLDMEEYIRSMRTGKRVTKSTVPIAYRWRATTEWTLKTPVWTKDDWDEVMSGMGEIAQRHNLTGENRRYWLRRDSALGEEVPHPLTSIMFIQIGRGTSF